MKEKLLLLIGIIGSFFALFGKKEKSDDVDYHKLMHSPKSEWPKELRKKARRDNMEEFPVAEYLRMRANTLGLCMKTIELLIPPKRIEKYTDEQIREYVGKIVEAKVDDLIIPIKGLKKEFERISEGLEKGELTPI